MRLLFGSWPAYGHLLPMLPLVRAAQRAGHDVVVTTGPDMAPVLERLHIRSHASGLTFAEGYEQLPGRRSVSELPAAEQAQFAARHLFGTGAARRAVDVLSLLDTWRPDLVVHDTLELGSATAAVLRGIPHHTHGYGPLPPGTADLLATIGSTVAAGLGDGHTDLPDPTDEVLAGTYLEICPPDLHGPDPSPWASITTLRPSAGESDQNAGTVAALDFGALPHRETVYVTLGTVMNDAPDVFRAVIDGATRHPVNLVVTTGPGAGPARLGPLPPAVHLADYLPQADVLPHCTAVISHAGAGTMLGALCHGLPQLCLPQSTDQPFNAAALQRTGASLTLTAEQTTSDTVASALADLLETPAHRAAAQRLRDDISRMPDADAVLDELLDRAAGQG